MSDLLHRLDLMLRPGILEPHHQKTVAQALSAVTSMTNALQVVVLDPHIRVWLSELDPQAFAQAERALRVAGEAV